MKTRIKEIEYASGKKYYQVQSLRNYDIIFINVFKLNDFVGIFIGLFFSPFTILYCIYLYFFWEKVDIFFTLEDAKIEIDKIYKKIELKNKQLENSRKSKKVVNKKYIKYP